MPPTAPSPLTWTLRLKCHKSTVVVHASPIESFDNIKAELLRALRETSSTGTLRIAGGPVAIPSDISDVILAKPIDLHDYTQGWRRLKIDEEDEDMEMLDEGGSAVSRGAKRKSTGQTDSSPKDAGLRDGGVLAFKFKGSGAVDENEDEGLGLGEEDDKFDVLIPSYEDSTGVTNEGDVGGVKNYNGIDILGKEAGSMIQFGLHDLRPGDRLLL